MTLFSLLRAGMLAAGVLVASAALAQQNNNAILNTSGAVTVNNVSVQESSPVFHGDTVKTEDGKAALATPGSSLSVPPRSQITFQGKTLDLKTGAVVVSTKTAMSTQVYNVNIHPTKLDTTRYEAILHCDEVTVHAYVGDLIVHHGDKTEKLLEGQTKRWIEIGAKSSLACVPGLYFVGGAAAAANSFALLPEGSVSPSTP